VIARSGELGRPWNHDPATAVFARRVKPGDEAEYESLARQMIAASEAFPGHLGATMLHEAGSSPYTLVYSFTDEQALRWWLDSAERRQLVREADPISESHVRLPPLTGLETWFALPHQATIKPPPRWKMWLVSLVAIYPLVVALQVSLLPAIKRWPLLLRAAALPLVLLTLMTFVVMPAVTRVVQPWLARGT
jgi:antibiotic biosynthesis monooxygenase (ABM) superfamily enzyme